MASTKKVNLFETEEGAQIIVALKELAANVGFNTDPTYVADVSSYPDNLIPFVDKHIKYLKQHPNINPQHYLANLRIMTKIRHTHQI